MNGDAGNPVVMSTNPISRNTSPFATSYSLVFPIYHH